MLNKKLSGLFASAVVALTLASSLEGALQLRETPKREKDNFAFAYPKDMNLSDPADIYFYVAGLAMQASQGGLEYGIQDNSGYSATGGAALPIKGGKVLNFTSWNYNPGVRVAFGGYIDHDAWMLEANWTWVHFSNYQSTTATGAGSIIPMWLTGDDATVASFGPTASAKWHGQYNAVDAFMGKPYYISRSFVLNPQLGLRLAFIDQNFAVEYTGKGARTDIYTKNNFWGIGIRAGMNSEWIIANQWRFFGGLGAAMLRSHYAVNQTYTLPAALLNTLNGSGINEHMWDNAPVLDLNLGIQWGMHFNCERNYVAIRAAYEFQEWFNHFQVRKIYAGGVGSLTNGMGNEALRTNFSLNGFSFAVQFDF